MRVWLGVDTLCWHARIEGGAVRVEEIIDRAAELGARHVQLTLHHVRDRGPGELETLRERAIRRGLAVLASGDSVGQAARGALPEDGAARVEAWIDRAARVGSPVLRVVSGFYRAELAGSPELIEAERRYVREVLRRTAETAADAGVVLLLENHSDFTVAEYRDLVEEVGLDRVGVFLDLVNPVSAFEDAVPVIEALAPFAPAGHVKDYALRSIPTDDCYHRHGFEVLWRYPGEGVADLGAALAALRRAGTVSEFFLAVEGLDNRVDVDDQQPRIADAFAHLRAVLGEET